MLISDEPYREIVYGAEVPWVPSIYEHTIVCYSYSKSLSLPGERVGWILVPNTNPQAARLMPAVAGAARTLGFVCAPALFQRVIIDCIDEPSDVEAYTRNRTALTDALAEYGYTYVEPDGAFYLWVKALEPDANAFCERAKKYELLAVPSDSFGMPGWFRLGLLRELRNDCQFATRLETVGGRVSLKVKRSAYIVLRETGFGVKPDPVVMGVVSLGWSGFTTIEGYAYNEYKRRAVPDKEN